MYQNDTNEYGCPLRDQTGSVGVQNFDMIVARLAPELRDAFEAERAARQVELDRYFAAGADASLQPDRDTAVEPLTSAHVLFMSLEHILERLGRPRLRELIESFLPRLAAQLTEIL
jgi:hypothetical protein